MRYNLMYYNMEQKCLEIIDTHCSLIINLHFRRGFPVSSQPRYRHLRQNLGAHCYSRAANCSSWNSSYVCSHHLPTKSLVLMSIFVWIWAVPPVWWDMWQRFCLSGNCPVRFRSRVLPRKHHSGTWVYRQRCVLSLKEKCQSIKEGMLDWR